MSAILETLREVIRLELLKALERTKARLESFAPKAEPPPEGPQPIVDRVGLIGLVDAASLARVAFNTYYDYPDRAWGEIPQAERDRWLAVMRVLCATQAPEKLLPIDTTAQLAELARLSVDPADAHDDAFDPCDQ